MDAKNKNLNQTHYQEIDALRGIAILSMIAFHTIYMLQFIFGKTIYTHVFFWQGVPMLIGGTFLTLSGLSLYLGAQRGKYNDFLALLKRSGLLFSLGMLFTFALFLADLGIDLYFGILHCIGLGTFISFYVMSLPKYINLAAGLLVIAIGMYSKFVLQPCWGVTFFWLYHSFCDKLSPQLDYYPLIPWIGFMFIGIFLGKQYYPHGKRSYFISSKLVTQFYPICFLGRHSLLIYCIHTPIIFGILYLLNLFQ